MELLQIAQHAADLDRASTFYARLLGDQPVGRFDPPGLLFFKMGRTRLLLDRLAPSALVYLDVPDVRKLVEDLRSEGVAIESEPRVIFEHADASLGPAGTQECHAFIRDSEDNLVGLVTCYPIASAHSDPSAR